MIKYKKKGEPIALVISPTGSSAGCTNVLAMRSANIIRLDPAIAEDINK